MSESNSERLRRAVEQLKQANNRLEGFVRGVKTIPPQAPTCQKCQSPRRPFEPTKLCDMCKNA